MNIRLVDKAWAQATLPLSFGGIGIRQDKDVELPAFISSTHDAMAITSSPMLQCSSTPVCLWDDCK